jgi:hypothetical protein
MSAPYPFGLTHGFGVVLGARLPEVLPCHQFEFFATANPDPAIDAAISMLSFLDC